MLIDGGLIIWPHCRGNNLHHLGVEVFHRIEDAEPFTHTKVYSGSIREKYPPAPPR